MDLLDPGIQPGTPALQADSLPRSYEGSYWKLLNAMCYIIQFLAQGSINRRSCDPTGNIHFLHTQSSIHSYSQVPSRLKKLHIYTYICTHTHTHRDMNDRVSRKTNNKRSGYCICPHVRFRNTNDNYLLEQTSSLILTMCITSLRSY